MKLTVTPEFSLVDEPLLVVVEALPAGMRVRISAELVDLAGIVWRSEALYDADADGRVDTVHHAAVDGTYDGVDGFGLAWSMLPMGPRSETENLSFPQLAANEPHRITIAVAADGHPPVVARIARGWKASDVHADPVREANLRGIFYSPAQSSAAEGRAALVLAGSGGGVSESLAPLLASRGIPTLALAYFGYADLPTAMANIPLEYFAEAARWLRRQTGATALTAMGISRGSEAAALLDIHFPGAVDRTVLFVPGHTIEAGFDPAAGGSVAAWALDGKPLPYVPLTPGAAALFTARGDDPKAFTPIFLKKWEEQDTDDFFIPFEQMHGPLLLLSAANDRMWPSWISGARIKQRLELRNRNIPVEHVCFEGAGHVISRPGLVMSRSTANFHEHAKMSLALGGIPRLNAHSALEAFRCALAFARA